MWHLFKKKHLETPISHHVGLYHNFDLSKIIFFFFETCTPPQAGWRHKNKILLQQEILPQNVTNATKSPGLNEAFNFKPFFQ